MSNLSAALATALQNDATIGPLVSGVISGRNFNLQDALLAASPYACVAVIDLPRTEQPYIGTRLHGERISFGQIEVRCISHASEDNAKALAEAVKTFIWSTRTVLFNGLNLPLKVSNILQNPDTNEDLTMWLEILTIDFI